MLASFLKVMRANESALVKDCDGQVPEIGEVQEKCFPLLYIQHLLNTTDELTERTDLFCDAM